MAPSQSKPKDSDKEEPLKALKLSCHDVGHTWTPSCVKCFVELFVNGYVYGLKVYGPLYAIGGLVSRFRTGKIKYIDIITGACRSSLFLAVNCAFMVTSFCFVRWLKGDFTASNGSYLPGMLCCLIAIVQERKERRGLLALYCLNVAVEAVHTNLKEKGYPVSIKHGEVIMFSVASALLIFLSNQKQLRGGFVSEFLRVLYQPSKYIQGSTNTFNTASMMLSWAKDLSKAAIAGYAMKVVPSLLFSLKSLVNNPGKIVHMVTRKDNFDLAVFFTSSVGSFQVLTHVISKLLPISRTTSSVIAASISGLSMFSFKSPAIALYVLLKSLEGLYFYIAKTGYLPVFKHADSVIYSVVCGYLLGLLLSEPHRVNAKYFRFVTALTNNRMYDINRIELDKLGFNGSSFIEKLKSDIVNGKKRL